MSTIRLAVWIVAVFAVPALTTGTAGAVGCSNEAVRVVQRSTFLPDCRGFELVSAVDKNGGDVIGDPARVRVADDGSAVGYGSLSEFGDSVGGGIATDYMAVRDPGSNGQGWVTHGILPPQAALTFTGAANGFEPRYEQDFSPDLSRGVLLAWRPELTEDPLVANVANLYLRSDLRTPDGGKYSLVTGCPLCIGPISPENEFLWPVMMAATPNLGRVLFESSLDLAQGAVGSSKKLYEWDAATGTVVLAGVLPDGKGALDSAAAGLPHGFVAHRHAISNDGRKVFFTANVGGVQNLYMRVDEQTTVQLNVPEAGVSSVAQSASFGDATPDGTRVFFITGQQLTPDAPGGPGGGGLYVYDTTLPETDPRHLAFLSSGALGVIGASADGQTVYFTGGKSLLPDQPPNPYVQAVYVWHDGQVSFVANLPDGKDQAWIVANLFGQTSRVSPSGSVVFLSKEPTAANPEGSCPSSRTHACEMLYAYAPGDRAAVCVSCVPGGAPPTADVPVLYNPSGGGESITGHQNRFITDDGGRVFFNSEDALVPQDSNGKLDVYEYNTTTGTVSLISSGHDTSDSYFMETTPSGSDVLFVTREQLVGWDKDSNYDVYDARIGGGFPEPSPVPPECAGEECRSGALLAPPPVQFTASSQLEGAGNLTTAASAKGKSKHRTVVCRKGFGRRHVHGKTRCVKRKGRAGR